MDGAVSEVDWIKWCSRQSRVWSTFFLKLINQKLQSTDFCRILSIVSQSNANRQINVFLLPGMLLRGGKDVDAMCRAFERDQLSQQIRPTCLSVPRVPTAYAGTCFDMIENFQFSRGKFDCWGLHLNRNGLETETRNVSPKTITCDPVCVTLGSTAIRNLFSITDDKHFSDIPCLNGDAWGSKNVATFDQICRRVGWLENQPDHMAICFVAFSSPPA